MLRTSFLTLQVRIRDFLVPLEWNLSFLELAMPTFSKVFTLRGCTPPNIAYLLSSFPD